MGKQSSYSPTTTTPQYNDTILGTVGGLTKNIPISLLNNAFNVKAYGALGDNTTDDKNAINAAITAAGVSGTVYFPKATYYSTGRHTPLQGQNWIGDGMGNSIIRGLRAFDYSIYFLGTSSVPIRNFYIKGLTIDADLADHASCMTINYAEDCIFEQVEFKNVASGGWLMKFGVSNGATETYLNKNNKFIDCIFDTHAGSLEMLLVFNATNTQIIRPIFRNKTSAGPILGLWQKVYNTTIENPRFYDLKTTTAGAAIYWPITGSNLWIINPYFENVGCCIGGSNPSDNGSFGETYFNGLNIINPICVGGANSALSTALIIGAVHNVTITNPKIDSYDLGIRIDQGPFGSTNPSYTNAQYWMITNPMITNCNQEAASDILHPGIKIGGRGGSYYGEIIGGNLYDTQVTPTQKYPITFATGNTYNNIIFRDMRLYPYGTGTAYGLEGTAVLGNDVIFDNCIGVNPNIIYAQGNVSGATTFTRVNGQTITFTLTGNITTTLSSGKSVGDTLTLIGIQDTTARTISKPSNVKLFGGAFSPTSTANAVDSWTLKWDGTNWREISRSLNLS